MISKEDVFNFWFEGVDESTTLSKDAEYTKRWFYQDEAIDAHIKNTFENGIESASMGEYDSWTQEVDGSLALVILLDQFPRCVYRNQAQAYDYDLKALEYAFRVIKAKKDEELPFYQRMFLYMPLMHSENMEIQDMALMYLRRLSKAAKDAEDKSADYFNDLLSYGEGQYEIVKKFKRFPHRNALLERRPTSEEKEFASHPETQF